ncbi:MAG: helicase-related protein, partial [Myxococcota bacterium]|nr:helicase-related protein [Myxococcota bacterium]
MSTIQSIQSALLNQIQKQNIVVTAPTGAGKSPEIPRWLCQRHPVLRIEPRRIAAKSLATRIASLENTPLGHNVGYAVRDDQQYREQTKLLIVTPGIAIRMMQADQLSRFSIIIFDEFHERKLELDLLLAMCLAQQKRVLLLSATVAAKRLAASVDGVHIHAQAREYPVDVRYEDTRNPPTERDLLPRLSGILSTLTETDADVLVFLPGKREIEDAQRALAHLHWDILPLHGSLKLQQQSRIYESSTRRRIILSTNVAETALTIPNIQTVIDSGLERRTCYHRGRAYLSLFPIATDSADQRAGRAGRLGPGIAIRMWSPQHTLLPYKPPEIYREALEPLVLAAAACGYPQLSKLPFIDPPHAYAVKEAREYLQLLRAFDEEGRLSHRGKRIFQLPLDSALGRLLIEAEQQNVLDGILPLCAALSIRRRVFSHRPKDPDLDIRSENCDLKGLIRAIIETHPKQVYPEAKREGLEHLRRLQRTWPQITPRLPKNVGDIAMCIMRAWPDSVHVARRRGKRIAWSNGGTEKELSPHSVIDTEKTDAIIVLAIHTKGRDQRSRKAFITAATPIPVNWIAKAKLGRSKLRSVTLENGEMKAVVERHYAGKLVETRLCPPPQELLAKCAAELFLSGRWERAFLSLAKERYRYKTMADALSGIPVRQTFEENILRQLEDMELESPEDLFLLSGEDLVLPAVDILTKDKIDREFP